LALTEEAMAIEDPSYHRSWIWWTRIVLSFCSTPTPVREFPARCGTLVRAHL